MVVALEDLITPALLDEKESSFLDSEFFSSQVIVIPKYVVPFVRVTPLAPSGLC